MAYQHDGSADGVKNTGDVAGVGRDAAERVRWGNDRIPFALQTLYFNAPAAGIGEGTMNKNHRRLWAVRFLVGPGRLGCGAGRKQHTHAESASNCSWQQRTSFDPMEHVVEFHQDSPWINVVDCNSRESTRSSVVVLSAHPHWVGATSCCAGVTAQAASARMRSRAYCRVLNGNGTPAEGRHPNRYGWS